MRLLLREPLGERTFESAQFPVSIGGAGSDVVVPARTSGPLAWIALHEDQLYVQPATEEVPLLHNGARVTGSTWLRRGDVIDVAGGRLRLGIDGDARALELLAGGDDNATAPPVAPDTSSVVGEGAEGGARIDPVAFRRGEGAGRAARSRWPRAAIALAAVLLAALALMVFTATPVQVEITPTPDRVAFDGGWPGLRFGTSHLLRPGEYTLVAERSGYATLRQPVRVQDDGEQVLRYQLAPLPGRLHVSAGIPAEVVIDGRVAGRAPGEFALPAGRHAVLVRAERHLDRSAEVNVVGYGKRQELVVKLVPAWARVQVLSEPSGATVRVDGRDAGTTPASLELSAGSRRVELLHAGFKTWVSDVQVKANQPLTVGPVRLGLPDGRLVVKSRPSGASVTIGGAYRGRTPLEVDVRPDLEQSVGVSREGYEPATRQVSVAPGGRAGVDVELTPIFGEVIVRARPEDAQLYVDGELRGAANQTLRLPATRHTVEIRRAGYANYRTTVTPRPGLPQNVDIALLEGASSPAPASAGATAGATAAAPVVVGLQPSLRSKAGQELRLVPAGQYTMGSPRREAGRRANESQRQVDLQRRFYVSTREVTNGEFRQFRADHRSGYVMQTTLDTDRQPVVNVSWDEAVAYCNWLSAQEGLAPAYEKKGDAWVAVVPATNGYRLPTEAEWEWIARRDGGGLRKYPWGDAMPVPPGAGNFADRSAQALLPSVLLDYDDGFPATAPVGSFAANPSGFQDLGGNVAEWTHDLYTVQPRTETVAVDPATTGAGALHVIRGSSWKSGTVTELRLAFRDYGEGRRNDLGFRIARYAQ